MSRNNYASKSARRAHNAELPVILPAFLADVEGLWAVELTNGSGRKVVEVAGTKTSAWAWAEVAGERGGIADGFWWPVDITPSANLVQGTEGASFALVS